MRSRHIRKHSQYSNRYSYAGKESRVQKVLKESWVFGCAHYPDKAGYRGCAERA